MDQLEAPRASQAVPVKPPPEDAMDMDRPPTGHKLQVTQGLPPSVGGGNCGRAWRYRAWF